VENCQLTASVRSAGTSSGLDALKKRHCKMHPCVRSKRQRTVTASLLRRQGARVKLRCRQVLKALVYCLLQAWFTTSSARRRT
jgi:hypothetical protein